ncbi:MAG: hydrogenase [Candidatus Omnitrophica bacterium]|nr:hydrogenase [Candidatus Omnitrophota bacterium]
MEHFAQSILISVVLANLFVLGSHPLSACIRAVALQGIALGLLPLCLHPEERSIHVLAIALGVVGLKGFLIPGLLFRAIRDAAIRREQEPLIGFNAGLLLGAVLIGLGFGIAGKLPLPEHLASSLVIPVALSTVMMGLLIIVTRAKILSQALGYLILENGIYAFGLILVIELPGLVEIGVLLDVFAGIFIMGTVIEHIHQEFGSISAHKLINLKE